MTRIRYVTQLSSFLQPCEHGIQENRAAFDAGRQIRFILVRRGGYREDDVITIGADDHDHFVADGTYPDPTRFGVRAKAAATAIRNLGYRGRFEVTHTDGEVTLRRVLD
jgi:hypothetical protein